MKLKELREDLGLTQEEVAKHLNCSPSTYARYERGVREPSLTTLKSLSKLYGVTVDYIIDNPLAGVSASSRLEIELIELFRDSSRASKMLVIMLLKHQKEYKN